MLLRVEITNFGCIRAATLELSPLTVLVGPNGSGKSTLLRALRPDSDLIPWRLDPSLKVQVSYHFSNGDSLRSYEPGIRTQTVLQDPRLVTRPLHLDVQRLQAPSRAQATDQLAEDGENLVNVIASMTRDRQGDLAKAFSALVPSLADFTVRPMDIAPGALRLLFQDRWSPEVWFEAAQVSDGSLLLLGLLAVTFQKKRPTVVTIEEPEHGVHPYLMGRIIETLRAMADPSGRDPMRVVVTTHSAELLAHVQPEEVRLISRSAEDGSTIIRRAPTDTSEWKAAIREYENSLSETWPSGALGGVPA